MNIVSSILWMSSTCLLNIGEGFSNRKEVIHMSGNEFRRPVSVDDAPVGSQCEWCGKPAIYQLMAIGGKHHNEAGRFCARCGEEFILAVADSLSRVMTTEIATQTHLSSL